MDPLPEEAKRNVVWRDSFWLPDEAASVYSKVRAACYAPARRAAGRDVLEPLRQE